MDIEDVLMGINGMQTELSFQLSVSTFAPKYILFPLQMKLELTKKLHPWHLFYCLREIRKSSKDPLWIRRKLSLRIFKRIKRIIKVLAEYDNLPVEIHTLSL